MRKKISATLSGRHLGPYSEARKEAARAGIAKLGDAWGASRQKLIAQMDDAGRVIWFWSAVRLAANHFGIDPSTITGVLKGRRKHAAGFRWFYAGVDALGPTDHPYFGDYERAI